MYPPEDWASDRALRSESKENRGPQDDSGHRQRLFNEERNTLPAFRNHTTTEDINTNFTHRPSSRSNNNVWREEEPNEFPPRPESRTCQSRSRDFRYEDKKHYRHTEESTPHERKSRDFDYEEKSNHRHAEESTPWLFEKPASMHSTHTSTTNFSEHSRPGNYFERQDRSGGSFLKSREKDCDSNNNNTHDRVNGSKDSTRSETDHSYRMNSVVERVMKSHRHAVEESESLFNNPQKRSLYEHTQTSILRGQGDSELQNNNNHTSISSHEKSESYYHIKGQDGKVKNSFRYEQPTETHSNHQEQRHVLDRRKNENEEHRSKTRVKCDKAAANHSARTNHKSSKHSGKSIGDLVSPLKSLRLRPIRQKTRNAVVSL